MSDCTEKSRFIQRVQQVAAQLREQGSDWFKDLLPVDRVDHLVQELGIVFRERIYTPPVTLWVFLSQVLSADHSCREAIARFLAWRLRHGQEPCSPETGSYCAARSRLPQELFTRLVRTTGEQLDQAQPEPWRWKGRVVKVVDGSTVTMPDTPENQAEYPQSSGQKPGLGFPIARLVVLFSLAVGTVLEHAVGASQGKRTGENQLFRGLMDQLSPDDVVLADRYYASYWDFAMLELRGVDMVARLHQRRRADFRCGLRLGKDDQLVVWEKPKQRPDWMNETTYRELPEEMVIREVRVRVQPKGFRVRVYVIATTLFDDVLYAAQDLADLYRMRWHAELDLRSLKAAMQMGHLRCRTPEMVRKELAMHLIAYNLVRRVMAEAARQHDTLPREISFKGALQTLTAFRDQGLLADPLNAEHLAALLAAIASHRVGDRPNRLEPRAVKRRTKHSVLTQPRHEARRKLPKAA